MPCLGSPWPCSYYPLAICWTCGCTWDEYYEECIGLPDSCDDHDNQADCEDCGCDWTVAGINMKVNTADVWKDGAELWINIGDVFKRGAEGWQNIGDVWKRVF